MNDATGVQQYDTTPVVYGGLDMPSVPPVVFVVMILAAVLMLVWAWVEHKKE